MEQGDCDLSFYEIRIDPKWNKIVVTNNVIGAMLDNNKWYAFINSKTQLTVKYTTEFDTLKSALIYAIEKYI
jgi:hypothetical protein